MALVGNAPFEDNLLACNLAVEYSIKAGWKASLQLFAHVQEMAWRISTPRHLVYLFFVQLHLRIPIGLVYNQQFDGAGKEIALGAYFNFIIEIDNRGVAT